MPDVIITTHPDDPGDALWLALHRAGRVDELGPDLAISAERYTYAGGRLAGWRTGPLEVDAALAVLAVVHDLALNSADDDRLRVALLGDYPRAPAPLAVEGDDDGRWRVICSCPTPNPER